VELDRFFWKHYL